MTATGPPQTVPPGVWKPLAPPIRRFVESFEPDGRPTPYGGDENERLWKDAIEKAVAGKKFTPPTEQSRLGVRVEFRTRAKTANDKWDPDNLLKSTFDAMGGVLGYRKVGGRLCADDERIDYVETVMRPAADDERSGARIEVYELDT